jgi:hypothetical protein
MCGDQMTAYWRCNNMFAVYIEYSRKLGPAPFLSWCIINGELAVNWPYGLAYITPSSALKAERRQQSAKAQKYDGHRNTKLPQSPARTGKA